MDEFRITTEIYSQIKDFQHRFLTNEQRIIIDKLIPSELHYSLRTNGLCEDFKSVETDSEIYKQCKELEANTTTRDNSAKISLSYQTHPQAIYTSRLLSCKKLSESYENVES
ncbi:4866_t:CDS:2, partial [Funneliformis mosseae]